MAMNKKRVVFYFVVLVVLGCLALWVFHEPDGLRELKEHEQVTVGTEEPIAFVKKALAIINEKKPRKLFPMMASHDSIEFDRIMGPVLAEVPGPVEIIGCMRLKKSSRQDNITVITHSESRGRYYLFQLLKNRKGDYRLYGVFMTTQAPSVEG